MALFLKLLWQYRRIAIWILIVAALALTGWRAATWRNTHVRLYPEAVAALEAERGCLAGSKCHERLRAAAEAARLEEAARQADAAKALEEREAKARADAAAWRAKYRSAVQTNPECKAWSEQPISCPL